MEAKLVQIRDGWAAVADWWAVFGASKEEALQRFDEAVKHHQEMATRKDGAEAIS